MSEREVLEHYAALRERVEVLELLVAEAYNEGFKDGVAHAEWIGEPPDVEDYGEAWRASEARRALMRGTLEALVPDPVPGTRYTVASSHYEWVILREDSATGSMGTEGEDDLLVANITTGHHGIWSRRKWRNQVDKGYVEILYHPDD